MEIDAESHVLVWLWQFGKTSAFWIFSNGAGLPALQVEEKSLAAILSMRNSAGQTIIRFSVASAGQTQYRQCLAAIATAVQSGWPIEIAISAKRVVSRPGRALISGKHQMSFTVIDDFCHNPDKNSLPLLPDPPRHFPGRVIAFFQPNGFGPNKKNGCRACSGFSRTLATTTMPYLWRSGLFWRHG